eukprot:scaffold276308_cov19-Tisochrysis_lutea.AAC.1
MPVKPRLHTNCKPGQVWLKFDLRIDDHEGLLAAASASSAVLPVYCIDYSQLDFLLHTPAGPEGGCLMANVFAHGATSLMEKLALNYSA